MCHQSYILAKDYNQFHGSMLGINNKRIHKVENENFADRDDYLDMYMYLLVKLISDVL